MGVEKSNDKINEKVKNSYVFLSSPAKYVIVKKQTNKRKPILGMLVKVPFKKNKNTD